MALLFLIALMIVGVAVVALFLGRSKKNPSDSANVAPPIADPHGESKSDSE